MDKKTEKRIREYKRDFDIDTQRAELLSRNKYFLDELEKTKNSFLIGEFLKMRGKRETIEKISIKKFTEEETIEDYLLHKAVSGKEITKKERDVWNFITFENMWAEFCDRWNIQKEWNSDLANLSKYLKAPVEIFWMEGKEKSGPVLFLRIDNWTTKKDIHKVWHEVEMFQNEIWEKQQKKTNFTRDLWWYDLSKKYGLKIKQIAKKWAELFPREIDLLVVRRIRNEIDKADLGGRALDDEQLLEAIKHGFLAKKYKSHFEDERTHYLTGKFKRGSEERTISPPFVDAIKKAIKRMDQQITQISISSLKISLDIKKALSFAKSFVDRSNQWLP